MSKILKDLFKFLNQELTTIGEENLLNAFRSSLHSVVGYSEKYEGWIISENNASQFMYMFKLSDFTDTYNREENSDIARELLFDYCVYKAQKYNEEFIGLV